MRTRARAAALALLSLASAVDARADQHQTCVDAHEQAQVERNRGHLRAARDRLHECTNEACPPLIVKDCNPWLDQVGTEMPTVVVAATDERSQDIVDVRVSVDGAPVVSSLNGRPIDVDPGQHVFRFDRPNGQSSQQSVLVVSGVKDRVLKVQFGAPSPTPPPPPTGDDTSLPAAAPRVPVVTWMAGGASVVALGAFAIIGTIAVVRHSDYRSQCETSGCAPGATNDVRNLNHFADLSLGIAVVAAGVAAVFFLTSRSSPSRSASSLLWGTW